MPEVLRMSVHVWINPQNYPHKGHAVVVVTLPMRKLLRSSRRDRGSEMDVAEPGREYRSV